jgi:hypothetical protein
MCTARLQARVPSARPMVYPSAIDPTAIPFAW